MQLPRIQHLQKCRGIKKNLLSEIKKISLSKKGVKCYKEQTETKEIMHYVENIADRNARILNLHITKIYKIVRICININSHLATDKLSYSYIITIRTPATKWISANWLQIYSSTNENNVWKMDIEKISDSTKKIMHKILIVREKHYYPKTKNSPITRIWQVTYDLVKM